MKNKPIIKLDDEEIEDLVGIEKNGVLKYLQNYFYPISHFFTDSKCSPATLLDASFVLNDLLKFNEEKSFVIGYKNGKENKSMVINKNNFYNGYADKIWKELSFEERAQIVKWHFDYKKNLIQYKGLRFSFIIPEDIITMYDCLGAYNAETNLLYINPYLLLDKDPTELMQTMEHEFEHANQHFHGIKLQSKKDIPMNVYEKFLALDFDNMLVFSAKNEEWNYLYRGSPKEMSAELKGLKNIKKYIEQNIKDGIGSEKDIKNFIKYQDIILFRNYVMPENEVKEKFAKKNIEKYNKGSKFIKNIDYVRKLVMLREYTLMQNFDDNLSQEEIKLREEKANLINDYLREFLKNNYEPNPEINDDFFEELNLVK